MRLFIYFCSLLCFMWGKASVSYAQRAHENFENAFTSDQWQVGLKDGYGKGGILENHTSFQIHTGYYVADKLMVGITAGWSKEWEGSLAFNDFTIGPLVRYQFTQTRLSPFIEASYQFGRRSANEAWRTSYPGAGVQCAFVSPGLSITLSSSLRIDISYGFQRLINSYTNTYGQPQLGINYLFRKN